VPKQKEMNFLYFINAKVSALGHYLDKMAVYLLLRRMDFKKKK
jgi:hypothetical protein